MSVTEYPPSKLDESAGELEKKLLLLLTAYYLGKANKSVTRRAGLRIIEDHFKTVTREVNKFYRKKGLRGGLLHRSKQLRELYDRIITEFEILLDSQPTATEKKFNHGVLLLSLLVTYSVAGRITLSVAKKERVKLRWNTQRDPSVCVTCEALEGQLFDPWNLPEALPGEAHLGCRCYWSLVVV